MKRYKSLEQYKEENEKFLSQPIVKNFLKKFPSNMELLEKSVMQSDKEAEKLLDKLFVEHFFLYRLVKYISTLSYYYSIDFDKRNKKQKNRYLLLLDMPINESEGEERMNDFLSFTHENFESFVMDKELLDLAENESLYDAIKKLTPKEIQILHHLIIDQLKQKDVAKIFGDSPQNIGKTKIKALTRIKKEIEKN